MNDEELIKQLKQLPDEIPAKDSWERIKMSIQIEEKMQTMDLQPQEPMQAANSRWFKYAASFCLVVVVGSLSWLMRDSNNSLEPGFNATTEVVSTSKAHDSSLFSKTLHSTQQASSLYYKQLGYSLNNSEVFIDRQTQSALKDLREANKQYLAALKLAPRDRGLQEKILNTYKKERKLLKRILA